MFPFFNLPPSAFFFFNSWLFKVSITSNQKSARKEKIFVLCFCLWNHQNILTMAPFQVGRVSNPFCPQNVINLVYFPLSLYVFVFGFFILGTPCSSWSFYDLLCLFKILLAELSQYCGPWDRNSIHWLMWHWPTTRAREVSVDVMVDGTTRDLAFECLWMCVYFSWLCKLLRSCVLSFFF